jgi:inorganic pyrophosphatase
MLPVNHDNDFWLALEELVTTSELTIDRPKGSPHPRHPSFVYQLDYGYLAGTRSDDGDGIDVWIGSLAERTITGIVCTADMQKRDVEIKILLGCTPQEAQYALAAHQTGAQSAKLVARTTAV